MINAEQYDWVLATQAGAHCRKVARESLCEKARETCLTGSTGFALGRKITFATARFANWSRLSGAIAPPSKSMDSLRLSRIWIGISVRGYATELGGPRAAVGQPLSRSFIPSQTRHLPSSSKFVDEYRKLRPTDLCTVTLGAGHNPTGKRVVYGFDGLMDKPLRVDLVRYRPEPLHFLRFHYKDRIEDWDLLMTSEGDYATTVRIAKEWVRDELQVPFASWKQISKSRRRKP